MLEIVTWSYNQVMWLTGQFITIEMNTIKCFADPGTFISGAVAGASGRAAVTVLDPGGVKGFQQTVARRIPQIGLLMMFYCPTASYLLPGLEKEPVTKMTTTFLIGACAGLNMRLVCNPINRVADECLRTGKPPDQVMRGFKSKTILHFWYCGPNLLANAMYVGVLFTVFEGLRRYTERNLLPIQKSLITPQTAEGDGGEVQVVHLDQTVDRNWSLRNYTTTIASNFIIGGLATAVASTVCYPYSAHRYLQTVIYDSAICRGLVPTLRKEVPMMAVALGTFSALQPLFGRRHGVRCGFGY